MAVVLSSILFFLHCTFIGFFLINTFSKDFPGNFLKKRMFELIFGFSGVVFLPYILGLLRIPIDIWIITAISLVLFVASIIRIQFREGLKNFFRKELKEGILPKGLSIANTFFLVLIVILFLFSTYTYLIGTIQQPYLEDGDPWIYAAQADLVAETKSYYLPEEAHLQLDLYLKPFPRRLTVLSGIYLQASDSPNLILKYFFNYFLIIGTIAFILFFFLFTNSYFKTFFATLFMVSAPSFVGRFIYENNVAVMLIGACLISIMMLLKGRREYLWIGGVAFAAQFVAHPPTAVLHFFIIGSVFLALFIKEVLIKKENILQTKAFLYFLMVTFGVLLSLIHYVQPLYLYGVDSIDAREDPGFRYFGTADESELGTIKHYNPNYSIKDFAIARTHGQIDQTIGIGLVLFILLMASIPTLLFFGLKNKGIFPQNKENSTVLWGIMLSFIIIFTFTFLGYKTGFSLFTGRYWPVLVVVSSVLFAEFIGLLFGKIKETGVLPFLFIIIVIGVLATSTYQDYKVQTSVWPVHVYVPSDVAGYNYLLQETPRGESAFTMCRANGYFLYGLDKTYDYYLSEEHLEFYANLKNQSSEEMFSFINSRNSTYFILDSACILDYDINKVNAAANLMLQSNRYGIVYNDDAFVLFKRVQ